MFIEQLLQSSVLGNNTACCLPPHNAGDTEVRNILKFYVDSMVFSTINTNYCELRKTNIGGIIYSKHFLRRKLFLFSFEENQAQRQR